MPPPAKAALSSRLIAASSITAAALATRAQARIDELAAAATTVLSLPEVVLALNLTQPVGPWQWELPGIGRRPCLIPRCRTWGPELQQN